jgi:D-aminopeptidase
MHERVSRKRLCAGLIADERCRVRCHNLGMAPPAPRPRARQFGLDFGPTPTGQHNAITDVPGARVGHVTVWKDEPDGSVARTGVTVLAPDTAAEMWGNPMAAGTAVLNGAGELTGSIEIREWGVLESPVVLVSTNNVGRGYDALVDAAIAEGVDDVVVPVVGECDDSWLDDISCRWLTLDHVRQALDTAAPGPVAEGVVGAGTGMITMGHKGGIGTSSRVLDGLGTIGVLLLCNFGGSKLLRIGGHAVGATLAAERDTAPTLDDGGSCIGVVLTDIPLDARQLERVARRVGLGLARIGTVAHHGSGDIFLAASTTNRRRRGVSGWIDTRLLADTSLDPVFTAVVDATEEAVTNALFVADTVTGVHGHVVPGLPVERVLELIGK